MLRIPSRPSQVLVSDALQVWCRLANHANIYTADPCRQAFVKTHHFNSSLRRLSSRSQQTRKLNTKLCQFLRFFVKVLRELRIGCLDDLKEFPSRFCPSCLVGALVGCSQEGNAANAVGKAFGALRTADRIHKTLYFMMSQPSVKDERMHTFAQTRPPRLCATKMIGRVVC